MTKLGITGLLEAAIYVADLDRAEGFCGATGPGHFCCRADGADFHGSRFHWPNGARSIYLRDPDGNSIECAEPKLWSLT